MELGNQKVSHNLLIIRQLGNMDTLYLLFARGRGERLWTTVNKSFRSPPPSPSKGGPSTDLYILSEILNLLCRMTCAWSEWENLYNHK